MPRTTQLALTLPAAATHGGKRRNAGRKPSDSRTRVAHVARPALRAAHPVHVTLRARPDVASLRSRRAFAIVAHALRGVTGRAGFRVVHFSAQGNHVHLIVEAADALVLSAGCKALGIRIALGINRMMRRNGPVLADRFHAHVLRTPAEVRRAMAYVLGNLASHRARAGRPLPRGFVDPCCSFALRARDAATCPTLLAATSWRGRGSSAWVGSTSSRGR
ncbi:MAG: transposase [Anaeromyxobacteraceae bacterium]